MDFSEQIFKKSVEMSGNYHHAIYEYYENMLLISFVQLCSGYFEEFLKEEEKLLFLKLNSL
jgi:hypothetical protein